MNNRLIGRSRYAEYATVRTDAKLSQSSLLQINVPAGTQPCTQFGIHPQLPLFKALYDAGDAAFFANIGTLIEPITKAEFIAKTKQVPPSLFAHNTQQRQSQSVHAQQMAAKGVLGRIRDALTAQTPSPIAANAYSITGSMKMVEGSKTAHMVNHKWGMPGLQAPNSLLFSRIRPSIFNLTSRVAGSVFGETFAAVLENSLTTTAVYGGLLNGATVTERFGEGKLDYQVFLNPS